MSVQGAACLVYGFKTYLAGTVGWGCSEFIRFLNLFLEMCLIAKAVLIFPFIIYTSKQCFGPFVSDLGNWYKYPQFCTSNRWLEGGSG